jgi:L-iditol 2-dehydrogenase
MKAAVLVEPGRLIVKDIPKPEPGPNEVLIKVTLAGVCGSDFSLFHGKLGVCLPVVPGHEAIGHITAWGKNVTQFNKGQLVTIQPNFPCGKCAICRAGHANVCPAKVRLGLEIDGVFAEYVKVPADYVWKIPQGISDEVAVFAEPLAVATHGLNVAAPQPGQKALVFGAGVIGLLTLQLAALAGAETTACDLEEKRLIMAKNLGAKHVLGKNSDMDVALNAYDVVYETSGAPVALAAAIKYAAPGGKIVLLGLPAKDHPVSTALIVRKELKILGSMIYTNEFPQVLKTLESGRLNTAALISAKIGLNDINEALLDFTSPDRIKTLVVS